MLWNDFSSISVVDSFVVATTTEAVVVLGPDTGVAYKPVQHLFLDTEPYEQKRSGDVITVRSRENLLYFIDISDLPNISLLGTADLGFPFYDFALFGQDLYICSGFKGLLRYTMINYQSLTFADSSMIGIHYTKVDIYGNELYALDDYNGILRYHITGIGFGRFVDMLYVPLRATSFTKVDSTIVIALDKPKLMLASFGLPQPTITATLDLFFPPAAIFAIDSLVVALNPDYDVAELINRTTLEQDQFELIEPVDMQLGGQTLVRNGENHLLLPAESGGLALYNLDRIHTEPIPGPAFLRPGPVVGLFMRNQRLYTGGQGNPVDIYSLGENGLPLGRETLYPGLTSVQAMDMDGEYLAVLYPSLRHTLLMDISSNPIVMATSIFVNPGGVNSILYNDEMIDTLRSLFVHKEFSVSAYTISDSDFVDLAFEIDVIDRIYDIAVVDSMLFISTGKAKILMYRIYRDFDYAYESSFGLPKAANEINRWQDKLLVFSRSQMLIYAFGDSTDGLKANVIDVINLPFSIESSVIDGNRLVAVGYEGFVLVDLSADPPAVIDHGGRGGNRIAAEDGIVAVSDGNSVHIYDVRGVVTDVPDSPAELPASFALSQNYPNPFNPSTTIEYSLAERSRVRLTVYNILGQRVNTLIDEERPAGTYTIEWNGTNAGGRPVASGVYFYRLSAGDFTEVRKMVLVK
jgi:hypothetical protein